MKPVVANRQPPTSTTRQACAHNEKQTIMKGGNLERKKK